MAQQLPLMDAQPLVVARPHRSGADVMGRRGPVRAGDSGPSRRGATGRSVRKATFRRPGTAVAVTPDRPGLLIEIAAVDWRIDEHTKEVGLAGVAAARRALAAATGRTAA